MGAARASAARWRKARSAVRSIPSSTAFIATARAQRLARAAIDRTATHRTAAIEGAASTRLRRGTRQGVAGAALTPCTVTGAAAVGGVAAVGQATQCRAYGGIGGLRRAEPSQCGPHTPAARGGGDARGGDGEARGAQPIEVPQGSGTHQYTRVTQCHVIRAEWQCAEQSSGAMAQLLGRGCSIEQEGLVQARLVDGSEAAEATEECSGAELLG
eukprot:scaffold98574_cov60-Phaeocystis_antarctica.AAC.6